MFKLRTRVGRVYGIFLTVFLFFVLFDLGLSDEAISLSFKNSVVFLVAVDDPAC